MLVISEKDGEVEFEVLAKPKSSRNGIEGVHDGALRIAVTAPPDKGKANAAIIKLLAKMLGIGKTSIRIIRGETSRRKLVRIAGVSGHEIQALAGEGGK